MQIILDPEDIESTPHEPLASIGLVLCGEKESMKNDINRFEVLQWIAAVKEAAANVYLTDDADILIRWHWDYGPDGQRKNE